MNKKTISNIFFTLRQIATFTPGLLAAAILEGVVWGLIHSVTTVVYLKVIFDQIEKMRPFEEILFPIVLMTIFLILVFIVHAWYWSYYQPKNQIVLKEKMHAALIEKAQSLSISHYDDPKFYEDFLWSIQETETRAISLLNEVGRMINRLIATFTMAGIIASVDMSIIAITLVALVFMCFAVSKDVDIFYSLKNALMKGERKLRYINRVYYLKDYAQDMRTTNIYNVMQKTADTAVNENIETIKKHKNKAVLFRFLSICIRVLFIDAGVLLILSYRLIVTQSISLGDFAAVVGGISTLFWQMNDLVDMFSRYKEHGLFAGKYRNFLEYDDEQIVEQPVSSHSFEDLEMKDVSFRYQENSELVLKDINFKIARGEKIALVGQNGSGKTTLTNLLLGFYPHSDGNIYWNKQEVHDLHLKKHRERFSVLFQDFNFFQISIAENLLGDFYQDQYEETIQNALSYFQMDSYIQSLKNGVHTEISGEFSENGANPSRGQLCRLGLAKVLLKDSSDIIVLDEPTAPLDPISEYELNNLLINGLPDKTILFISHRLSTAKMVDRIYVIDDGEIIEAGSHEELMAQNGKYAEMFLAQASQYQKGGEPVGASI